MTTTIEGLRTKIVDSVTHRLHTDLYVTIQTRYPCCDRRGFFRAIKDVSREIYKRDCLCGSRWTVERRTLVEASGKRIDILEWERK